MSREPLDPRFRSGPPVAPPDRPPSTPDELASLVADAGWEQIWVKAGSEVWRVHLTGGGTAYLKIIDDPADFTDEVERLRWLAGRSPVATPPVLGVATDEAGRGWVLTSGLVGIAAHEPTLLVPDAAPLIEAMGTGLRRFHDSLLIDDCPFRLGTDELLASAEARVARGDVDPSTMASSTYRRLSADRLLEHLRTSRPAEPAEDLVVAHGDPSQPNFLIDPTAPTGERLSGLVDVGRLGVSDRYRDLAIVARSLVTNLDGEASHRFFDAYGLANPDPLRLEWYVLVDDMW